MYHGHEPRPRNHSGKHLVNGRPPSETRHHCRDFTVRTAPAVGQTNRKLPSPIPAPQPQLPAGKDIIMRPTDPKSDFIRWRYPVSRDILFLQDHLKNRWVKSPDYCTKPASVPAEGILSYNRGKCCCLCLFVEYRYIPPLEMCANTGRLSETHLLLCLVYDQPKDVLSSVTFFELKGWRIALGGLGWC